MSCVTEIIINKVDEKYIHGPYGTLGGKEYEDLSRNLLVMLAKLAEEIYLIIPGKILLQLQLHRCHLRCQP